MLSSQPAHRIGLVVPSSNVTVETDLPAMLRRPQPIERKATWQT